MQGLMEHMQDLATQNPDKQKEMAKKLEEGKLSIRDWREQIANVMNMYVFIPLFHPLLDLIITSDISQGSNLEDSFNDSGPPSRDACRL
jgi:signal recognition particle GTPase